MPSPMLCNSLCWMELRRKSGGEGGIRTLDTGVSPYNGLANESFSPPSLVFKGLRSDPIPLSRTQGLSFGSYCAPLCAPDLSRELKRPNQFRHCFQFMSLSKAE
jgi:hypothetical protein